MLIDKRSLSECFFHVLAKVATPTKAPLHPPKAVPDTVPITGSVTVPTPAPPTAPNPADPAVPATHFTTFHAVPKILSL